MGVFRISGTSTLEDKMGSWRKEIAAIFITALKRRQYLEKNVAFQFRSPFSWVVLVPYPGPLLEFGI